MPRKKKREEEKRRKIDEQVAARRQAEEEKRRAKEEAKAARRKGFGRILHGEPDEFDQDDDAPIEPIPDIVSRLQRYSGTPESEQQPETDDESPPQS